MSARAVACRGLAVRLAGVLVVVAATSAAGCNNAARDSGVVGGTVDADSGLGPDVDSGTNDASSGDTPEPDAPPNLDTPSAADAPTPREDAVDTEPSDATPDGSVFEEQPTQPDLAAPPHMFHDIVPLADGNIGILWSWRSAEEVWCPDCEEMDIPDDECPAQCAREHLVFTVSDLEGRAIESTWTARTYVREGSGRFLGVSRTVETGDGDIVVAWRMCEGPSNWSCRAEIQRFSRIGEPRTERVELYERRYGALRIAAHPQTGRVLVTSFGDLTLTRGVGALLLDADLLPIRPWWMFTSPLGAVADVAGYAGGFLMAAADDAPSVAAPNCPFCESYICGPHSDCPEGPRSEQAGVQLHVLDADGLPVVRSAVLQRHDADGRASTLHRVALAAEPGFDGRAVAVATDRYDSGVGVAAGLSGGLGWEMLAEHEEVYPMGATIGLVDGRAYWLIESAVSIDDDPAGGRRMAAWSERDGLVGSLRYDGVLAMETFEFVVDDGRPVAVGFIVRHTPEGDACWGFLRVSF